MNIAVLIGHDLPETCSKRPKQVRAPKYLFRKTYLQLYDNK